MSFSAFVRPSVLSILVALSLLVPTLTLADPIEEPVITETLVEGHTVFLTIEAYQYDPEADAAPSAMPQRAPRAEFAEAGAADAQIRVKRFPGVLWSNDQYVVDPWQEVTTGLGTGSSVRATYGATMAVLVRADDGRVREPCGGALLAVNEGDPDPRIVLASVTMREATVELDVPEGADDFTGDVDETVPGRSTANGPEDPAWLGAQVGPTSVNATEAPMTSVSGWSDTVVGSAGDADIVDSIGYEASYLLADPNDHVWIVDKYVATTRVSLPDGNLDTYSFTMWATNILGGPVFVPDADVSWDENTCLPEKEFTDDAGAPVDGFLCGAALNDVEFLDAGNDADVLLNAYNGAPAWSDDPCMSYQEPSRNGYCYQGTVTLANWECGPERRYHALLYFAWEDLTSMGEPRDHCTFSPEVDADPSAPGVEGGCDPGRSGDTNGCQSATEWTCPGEEPWIGVDGADELEGNSHAFHPTAPPHEEAEPCEPTDNMTNPVNHGGSLYGTIGRCDYWHATARVDVYFSGAARPFVPAARNFLTIDLEGSSAPFFDFHTAFPGVP